MSAPPSDDDLRRRLQELGQRESAGAPKLGDVLRGRRSQAIRPTPRPLMPAAVLAAIVLVTTFAWWSPMPQAEKPVATNLHPPLGGLPEDWVLPSDRLLVDAADLAGARDVEQLSREIERLLKP